jgi:hypothetical protein
VTDGAFSNDRKFLPLPSLDGSAVMQLFRRLRLLRLHQAERLTESFMNALLSWVHPGFLVYARPAVEAAEIASLESQARYITRRYWPWMRSKYSTTAIGIAASRIFKPRNGFNRWSIVMHHSPFNACPGITGCSGLLREARSISVFPPLLPSVGAIEYTSLSARSAGRTSAAISPLGCKHRWTKGANEYIRASNVIPLTPAESKAIDYQLASIKENLDEPAFRRRRAE